MPIRMLLVPVMALVLALAACGPLGLGPAATPSATPLPPTAGPDTTPTATAQPVPSVEPATATPEPLRLTLWTTEQGAAFDLVQTLASDYATRAGVIIEVIPKSATGVRVDMIAASLVQEAPPGMIWGNQDDLAGLLADDQLQPYGTPATAAAFIPAVVSSATRDDQLWGQPIAARDYLLLLYNRAFIQQPPTTTDALIMQSRAVPGPDRYGIVAAWNQAHWLLAWLNGSGGTLTTPDGTQPTLDTPQMIAALNLHKELHMAAPPEQQSYLDGSALFEAGQVALAIDGDWAIPGYREGASLLDLGVAALPRVPATGQLAGPPMGGSYLMLPQNLDTEEHAAARAFGAFLVEPDRQLQIAAGLQRLPALQSALETPLITEDTTLAAAAAQAMVATGLPPTDTVRCALSAMNGRLPAFLADQADAAQTANVMQQSAQTCLVEVKP